MNLAEDLGDHRLLTDNKVNSWQVGHVPVASYSPKIQTCKPRETATTEHIISRLQKYKSSCLPASYTNRVYEQTALHLILISAVYAHCYCLKWHLSLFNNSLSTCTQETALLHTELLQGVSAEQVTNRNLLSSLTSWPTPFTLVSTSISDSNSRLMLTLSILC